MIEGEYHDGFTQEALDITQALLDAVENVLMKTRCAEKFPDVKDVAFEVHEAVAELHELIGSKMRPSANPNPVP